MQELPPAGLQLATGLGTPQPGEQPLSDARVGGAQRLHQPLGRAVGDQALQRRVLGHVARHPALDASPGPAGGLAVAQQRQQAAANQALDLLAARDPGQGLVAQHLHEPCDQRPDRGEEAGRAQEPAEDPRGHRTHGAAPQLEGAAAQARGGRGQGAARQGGDAGAQPAAKAVRAQVLSHALLRDEVLRNHPPDALRQLVPLLGDDARREGHPDAQDPLFGQRPKEHADGDVVGDVADDRPQCRRQDPGGQQPPHFRGHRSSAAIACARARESAT